MAEGAGPVEEGAAESAREDLPVRRERCGVVEAARELCDAAPAQGVHLLGRRCLCTRRAQPELPRALEAPRVHVAISRQRRRMILAA